MNNKTVYHLTQEGADALKLELTDLKENKRPKNIQEIKESRADGDLSENADYKAARDEQARIETRIQEIEFILKNVKIIKINADDKVSIGKKVTLRFIAKDRVNVYTLVGTIEADPSKNKISIDSPLGRAIEDRQKGDVVVVKAETGNNYELEIVDVSGAN